MAYELFSPWPMVSKAGDLAAGSILPIHPTCRTCDHKKCRAFHGNASTNLNVLKCPKGLNCFAHKDDKETVVFIGLGDPSRVDLPRSFSRHREYVVAPDIVRQWILRTTHAIDHAHLVMTEDTERAIQGLHNIQPAVNMVLRAAERPINMHAGSTFEQRLDASTQAERDLYYAANLLTWMIDIQHDLVRPETILHGERSSTPIYEMVDRFVRSFRLLAGPHKRIRLEGQSYRRPRCFDSVATLLFIILHNAIKYSIENQEIVIRVNDPGNYVEVSIESYGPAIRKEELDLVFTAGARGRHAREFTTEGSGRGLYVAHMIAQKHGTYIECTPPHHTVDYDGIPCGTNTFAVRLY
ncbi:MAG TPA: ATP-binding protein [Tepidisphaeraceae bacterium]|nr:ATP-binding protein [Tepidisphaeraceae bacterium]